MAGLELRNKTWHMRMRRPVRYEAVFAKKTIYRSLQTDSRKRAEEMLPMVVDQVISELDDLLKIGASERSETTYKAAVAIAARRGLEYKSKAVLLEGPVEDILDRAEALAPSDGSEAAKAIMGEVAEPSVRLSELVDAVETFMATENRFKNSSQMRKWRLPLMRAVTNLTAALGGEDREVMSLTPEDARKHRNWWIKRVAKEGQSFETINKDMNNMSSLVNKFYLSQNNAKPPELYRGLRMKDKHHKKQRKLEIPEQWMLDCWFRPGALDGMNAEARDIMLVSIETGCRESEIHDLPASAIVLDHPIPHLKLANEISTHGEGGREVKTAHAARLVPLLGVALAAMKRHPEGFPRYRNTRSYSGGVNKFLRENGLLPSEKHTVGGTRHAFESRLKAAGLHPDLRAELMGHSVEVALERPWYGDEMPLETKVELMSKIVLPVPDHLA
jgi:hypothetical protein